MEGNFCNDFNIVFREQGHVLEKVNNRAEEFLDKCSVIEKRDTKQKSVETEVINMNYDFIEDNNSKKDIDGHTLMMVNAPKLELLQHPLCLAIIHDKWYRIRPNYYFSVMLYMIFFWLFTSYIL